MIAIHQPNYIPWLGFFDKTRIADCLVLLDNVPYTRGSVINRNKIKTNRGWQWITIPVHHRSDTPIKDVLTLDSGWEQVHWKTLIMNYSKAPYFGEISSMLHEIYEKRWPRLAELNETIIRLLLDYLNLNPRIIRASELEVKGKSSELLVSICKAVNDREYLSGTGAREYLDLSLFRKEHIAVKFQEFRSPEYQQLFGQFIPNLSAIDYFFNCGNAKWWPQ
jgi:hypothetical protein